jgi:hypothetical protein
MARITTSKAQAARKSWQERAETWRNKINVSALLTRLEKYASGDPNVRMEMGEIRAAGILLDRVMPTLSASDITHTEKPADVGAMLVRLREVLGAEAYTKLAGQYAPAANDDRMEVDESNDGPVH